MGAIFIYPAAKVPTRRGQPCALLSWSSGKDSAWALHVLRQQAKIQIVGLLTTVSSAHNRVAVHAVRTELLRAQAEAVGLPLWQIEIPHPCSEDAYARIMGKAMARARNEGISKVAFGDLFLEDVRRYREEKLRGTGIEPLFPLWGLPTSELAHTMLDAGVRAYITCVDPKLIPASFAGRSYDQRTLNELPAIADPCGERGEFHTFACDGPMFSRSIPVQVGERIEREGFVFADLIAP